MLPASAQAISQKYGCRGTGIELIQCGQEYCQAVMMHRQQNSLLNKMGGHKKWRPVGLGLKHDARMQRGHNGPPVREAKNVNNY